MVSRVAMILLLGCALATAGCDRGSDGNGQAAAGAPLTDEVAGPGAAGAPRAGEPDRSHRGEPAPDVTFTAPDGRATTLAAFKGKPLLVNLWATWCAPCVKELPTLDAAAKAGAARFRTVAISQDMDPAKARAFLKEKPLAAAEPLFDPKLSLGLSYQANLPTTILYDASGAELWRVTGELDWTGEAARALLAEAK